MALPVLFFNFSRYAATVLQAEASEEIWQIAERIDPIPRLTDNGKPEWAENCLTVHDIYIRNSAMETDFT